MDQGHTDDLIFFAFDLLFLQGQNTAGLPLIKRKERLQSLFRKAIPGLQCSDHCGFRRKSATRSDLKPATDSDLKSATCSDPSRPPIPI
jgi:bifunctional non-homologous end joining protein LigD